MCYVRTIHGHVMERPSLRGQSVLDLSEFCSQINHVSGDDPLDIQHERLNGENTISIDFSRSSNA